MTDTELARLVAVYLVQVDAIASQLRAAFGCQDLLRAVRSGNAPRAGRLPSGLEYEFHGVGCRARWTNGEVDFDFGPRGRSDGFDAWRLHTFSRSGAWDGARCALAEIEGGLARLQSRGVVVAPKWAPSEHLLYLADGAAV